jgi:hypothetical protein
MSKETIQYTSQDYSSSAKTAAKRMNVDVSLILQCKHHPAFDGCFRENRSVNVTLLRKLLADPVKRSLLGSIADEADTIQHWKKLKTKCDALIAEKELEEINNKYVLREDIEKSIEAIGQAQRILLKNKLVEELPPQLAGLTVPEIMIKMDQLVNSIHSLMQNMKI